jgi:hypothetical protein
MLQKQTRENAAAVRKRPSFQRISGSHSVEIRTTLLKRKGSGPYPERGL